MAESESSVRQLLRDAVPPDLEADPSALIAGAAAQARRSRSVRAAGGAVAALVVAAVVGAAWLGVERPRPEPARPAPNPVTQELCRSLRPSDPPSHPAADLSGESAALCPAGTGVGSGWVLPGAPLTMERWVDYLRAGIASTPTAPCVTSPTGPEFELVVKRIGADPLSYRSSDLACGGREVVARYLAALAYQQADRDAAGTSGDDPHCSPPKPAMPIPLITPEATLRAVHSSGILCSYPLFDPSSPDRLVPQDYHSVRLTAEELAAIDADLASSTFSTTAPAECRPSRHELTLRLETVGAQIPEEGHVELVGTCLDVLRLAGNPFWWRPDASTLAVLARLLPAD